MTDTGTRFNHTKAQWGEVKRKIYDYLLKGYTRQEIHPIIRDEHPDLERHTVSRWIKELLNDISGIVKENEDLVDLNTSLAIERLMYLYTKAVEKDEVKVAFDIFKQVMKLQGVGIDPVSNENSDGHSKVKSNDVSTMSIEELKQLAEGG